MRFLVIILFFSTCLHAQKNNNKSTEEQIIAFLNKEQKTVKAEKVNKKLHNQIVKANNNRHSNLKTILGVPVKKEYITQIKKHLNY